MPSDYTGTIEGSDTIQGTGTIGAPHTVWNYSVFFFSGNCMREPYTPAPFRAPALLGSPTLNSSTHRPTVYEGAHSPGPFSVTPLDYIIGSDKLFRFYNRE